MLTDRVLEVLARGKEEVLTNPMELLIIYSTLYLNGGQPNWCKKSIERYYEELKLTGLKKAKVMESKVNRTCKPKWKGLRYIWGDFYSDETITDEQAIKLLKSKGLQELEFEVLPEGYKSSTKAKAKEPQAADDSTPETSTPKTGKTKKE